MCLVRELACTLPPICFSCAGIEPSPAPCNPCDSQEKTRVHFQFQSVTFPNVLRRKCRRGRRSNRWRPVTGILLYVPISWNIWKADNFVEWSFLSVRITFSWGATDYFHFSSDPCPDQCWLLWKTRHTPATDGAQHQAGDLKYSWNSLWLFLSEAITTPLEQQHWLNSNPRSL